MRPAAVRPLRGLATARLALALGALGLVHASITAHQALEAHRLYLTGAFDLGAFDQALWLISRGLVPFSTVIGVHVLGDHASVLLYPLALLYVVVPDVRALLVLQAVAVSLGALPLFLLGKSLGKPVLGFAAAVAFLAHPATVNLALFHFHPDALAGTLLLFALLAFRTGRPRGGLLLSALVLASKESAALTVGALGLQLLATRRRGAGAALVGLSAAWLLLSTRLLIPHHAGRPESVFVSRYAELGGDAPGVVKGLVTHPGAAVRKLAEPDVVRYLTALLGPFLLLPALAPGTLAVAAPAVALNVFSSFPPQRSLYFHYDALVVPLLAVALLDGLVALDRRLSGWRRLLPLAGLATCLVAALVTSRLRVRDLRWAADGRAARASLYDSVLSRIPPGASVAASDALQPHLAHRAATFLFPNPLRPHWFLRPEEPVFTRGVDVIVVDTRPGPGAGITREDHLTLDALVRGGAYRREREEDGVVVLVRRD